MNDTQDGPILSPVAPDRAAQMLPQARLLVVDDSKMMRMGIARSLKQLGVQFIEEAAHGRQALERLLAEPFDLMLLDVEMPEMTGLEVLAQMQQHPQLRGFPVIVISGGQDIEDVVRCIEMGADDYLAKPFHMEEVLARLRALLRRAAGHASADLVCGLVRLDTRSGRVLVDGNPIKLTSHEYRLLAYLMHHAGRVVSRTEIVEHLYDQDFDRDSNTIEVFVGRLRKKIGNDMIQTVRGLGYILAPPGEAAAGRP